LDDAIDRQLSRVHRTCASVTKTANETAPAAVAANDTDNLKRTLKTIGGSRSDDWNNMIARQTVEALWLQHSGPETQEKQIGAALAALVGIGPKDELEGMMAAQLVAAHNAGMECYRRAMIDGQTFEGRRENLTQANKLSRTYATLLEALNRHRGKGQRKMTVEHVRVYPGGQAVVGVVEPPGRRDHAKLEDRCHAGKLPMHLSPRCGAHCRTTGQPCRNAAMANGRCRMHGGRLTGAPKGNRNNFRHGRYSAESIAGRREVAALIRTMRALACATEEAS
jgi:hypothetical protein